MAQKFYYNNSAGPHLCVVFLCLCVICLCWDHLFLACLFSTQTWKSSFFHQANYIWASPSFSNTFVVVSIICKCCKCCQHNCFVCQLPHDQIFHCVKGHRFSLDSCLVPLSGWIKETRGRHFLRFNSRHQ